MSKKHYIEIAKILKQSTDTNLIYKLCDYFASDNPNFNREMFLKACINKEKIK